MSTPEASDSAVPSSAPTVSPKAVATQKPTAVKPNGARIAVASLPSTFRSDDKRNTALVDTIIVHSLYNPDRSDPFTIEAAKAVLDISEVSSHFVIARDGKVYQLVPDDYQAWHAGNSTMPAPDGRSSVNTFSIGIELTGNETSGFTAAQYTSLAKLSADLMDRLSITKITGHIDIAPGRKTDPWGFEWKTFESLLKKETPKAFQILGTH
jgi:N-acetyl-anhydromuramyl-L-alanine amidase AmpD